MDLEKEYDRRPRVAVRWVLRKLCVDEWLIHTVMTLYTKACTVVKTDAGLSKSFDVKVCCLLLSWMLSPMRQEVVCFPSCCIVVVCLPRPMEGMG